LLRNLALSKLLIFISFLVNLRLKAYGSQPYAGYCFRGLSMLTPALPSVNWQPKHIGRLAVILEVLDPISRAALSALISASSGPATAISPGLRALSQAALKYCSLVPTMIRLSPDGVDARRTAVVVDPAVRLQPADKD
jgi:hypothetical protein